MQTLHYRGIPGGKNTTEMDNLWTFPVKGSNTRDQFQVDLTATPTAGEKGGKSEKCRG